MHVQQATYANELHVNVQQEQTPLNRSQQLPALYKRLTEGFKQNWLREWLENRQFDLEKTVTKLWQ